MCKTFIPIPPKSAMTSKSSVSSNIRTESSSAMITKQLAQHLALLLGVIRSQRWSAFANIVLSNPNTFQMICTAIPKYEDFKGATLLHACLCHNPPLEVVVQIITMLPDRTSALRVQDSMGRTPLHIAVACDAEPMVIKILSSTDPTTCSILDSDGRSPLHLACDSSCCIQDDIDSLSQPRERKAPSYGSVLILLSESLGPALIEDEDGMSALEYAIISDASIEIVKLLQKVAVRSLQEIERHRLNRKRRVLDLLDVHLTPTRLQHKRVCTSAV